MVGRIVALTILTVSIILPGSLHADHSRDVAVIIGNRDYQGDLPDVTYARRDARAFARLAREILNIQDSNIIHMEDARQAEILAVFGNERSHQGRLWQLLDPEGHSRIYVFYSGHGVPDSTDGTGYLLPTDAAPSLARINGYPLTLLLKNLAKLEARKVTVFLDSCFSGLSPAGPLLQAASPVFAQPHLPQVPDGITLISASASNQLASWDEQAGHGLFTRYLLTGLAGQADQNQDFKVTAGEIKQHLDDKMTAAARRLFARDQVAGYQASDGQVLTDLSDWGYSLAEGDKKYPLEPAPGHSEYYAELPEEDESMYPEGELETWEDDPQPGILTPPVVIVEPPIIQWSTPRAVPNRPRVNVRRPIRPAGRPGGSRRPRR